MSVTFTFDNAPQHTESCEWCEEARQAVLAARGSADKYVRAALDGSWVEEEDVDELTDAEVERVRCDPWCKGEHTETVPEAAMNVANGSSVVICDMLGLLHFEGATYDFGVVKNTELPELQRRITRRLNGDLTPFTSEPTDEQGWEGPRMTTDPETGMPTIIPGHAVGPRIVSQGYSEDRVSSYLTRLQDIVVQAAEAGADVYWG